MTFELLFNVLNYLTPLKHILIEKLFFLACSLVISLSHALTALQPLPAQEIKKKIQQVNEETRRTSKNE